MQTKTFNYKFQVLEAHLDTFGHVNNATYLQLYEEARWDFITANGYGMDKIKESQVGPVILDLHLTFKREMRCREKIIVTSKVKEVSNKMIMTLFQTMTNEDDKVTSTLELTVGLMDLKTRKLVAANNDWLKAVGLCL